jgi:hypothetical protein
MVNPVTIIDVLHYFLNRQLVRNVMVFVCTIHDFDFLDTVVNLYFLCKNRKFNMSFFIVFAAC